jgi:hypothetical protein
MEGVRKQAGIAGAEWKGYASRQGSPVLKGRGTQAGGSAGADPKGYASRQCSRLASGMNSYTVGLSMP